MKKILMIFCLISTATFASNENPPLSDDNTQITGVESSISEVWEVAIPQEFQVVSTSKELLSASGSVTILCMFGDGEFWMGTSSNTSVVVDMMNHCSSSGGQTFIGPNSGGMQ